MSFTISQYAQALFEALHEVDSKGHDIVIDNFVHVLEQHNDLGKFEAVIAEYEALDKKHNGVRTAEITLARDAHISKGIIEDLNRIAGAKLEMRQHVDEGIVGGMVIKIDDTLIDASVKGKLDTLRQHLEK